MNPIEYTRMYEAEDHHWWYVGLHDLVLRTIQRESLRQERVLNVFDAGCGTGRLCQLMATHGHRVKGCDISKEALRLCQERGVKDVCLADLNSFEPEPDAFDVITSMDVLYHAAIGNDIDVLKRLRNALKPGGMLILNLVALEFLRSTHDIAVCTRERYTRRLLRERLQMAGFSVSSCGYRVSLLFPFIAARRLFARLAFDRRREPAAVDSDVSLPHPRVNALLLQIIRLENKLNRIAGFPFGTSVFAIARRPACHFHSAGEQ